MWILLDHLDLVKKQFESLYSFEPYHQMIESPYNYHQFGIHFIKPLIHIEHSTLQGKESLEEIAQHMQLI